LTDVLTLWDVSAGTARAAVKPCNNVEWLAWHPSQQLVAAACGDSTGIVVLRLDGTVAAHPLQDAYYTYAAAFDLRGGRLFGLNSRKGVFLWDTSNYQEVLADPSIFVSTTDLRIFGGAAWSRDLGRIAFLSNIPDDYVPKVIVQSLAEPRATIEIAPGLRALDAWRSVSGLIGLHEPKRVGSHLWDPAKDAYDDRLQGLRLSADRKKGLNLYNEQVVDLATGAVTRVRKNKKSAASRLLGWTPRGTYVVGDRVTMIRPGAWIRHLDVWDPATGEVKASARLADKYERDPFFAVSPDESTLAVFTQIERLADFSRCKWTEERSCVALLLVRIGEKKPIATTMTRLPDEAPPPLVFNADGSALAAGGDVYDGRTGAQILATGGRMATRPWTPDGRRILSLHDGKARVWELGMKRAIAELEGVDDVVDTSPDGALLLARSGPSFALWEATTGRRLVALPIAGRDITPFFSQDGRFVYWGSDLLGIHRVSDGQTLYHVLHEGHGIVTFTPEGVFDGDPKALMFRLGPDIAHADLLPAERFAVRFAHPELLADFLAGKAVTPQPSSAPQDL
jgi:WD40 repeat protein